METKQTIQHGALVYFAGLIAALVFLTGCGGGGGGGDDDNGSPPNPDPEVAPAQISGSRITLEEGAGEQRQIEFAAEGNTWSNSSSNGEAHGTYTYERESGNQAMLTLTTSEYTQILTLSFSSEHNGVYTYTSGPPISGGFVLEQGGTNPDPNDPDPDDPNEPPQTGLAPASISGRTMLGTRTYTSTGPSGQTHTYTFASKTFHDSDPPEESDGNYTWTPSGDQASLVLDYTQPEFFKNDHHEIQMTFATKTSGTFTSLYTRGDGTTIVINGNFEFP